MKDAKLHCSAEISTGRLIHMLSHQMKRQDILDERRLGLTAMQAHTLKFILMNTLCREIYQRDIEAEFQIRRPTATGILQLLEKNGFIERESVPGDARLKRIVPTKKAEGLRAAVLENIREMERRLVADIPEEELSACRDVMWHMLENLRALNEPKRPEAFSPGNSGTGGAASGF